MHYECILLVSPCIMTGIVDIVPNFYKFDNNDCNKNICKCTAFEHQRWLKKSIDIAVGFFCSLVHAAVLISFIDFSIFGGLVIYFDENIHAKLFINLCTFIPSIFMLSASFAWNFSFSLFPNVLSLSLSLFYCIPSPDNNKVS